VGLHNSIPLLCNWQGEWWINKCFNEIR